MNSKTSTIIRFQCLHVCAIYFFNYKTYQSLEEQLEIGNNAKEVQGFVASMQTRISLNPLLSSLIPRSTLSSTVFSPAIRHVRSILYTTYEIRNLDQQPSKPWQRQTASFAKSQQQHSRMRFQFCSMHVNYQNLSM